LNHIHNISRITDNLGDEISNLTHNFFEGDIDELKETDKEALSSKIFSLKKKTGSNVKIPRPRIIMR
jgi:superfamily II helicase